MKMKTNTIIGVLSFAILGGCQASPDGVEDVGETDAEETDEVDRQAPWCEIAAPPAPAGILSADDLQRIAALPYYASAVLDVRGTERFGTTSLAVEPDGRTVLRVVTSDRQLARTFFAEIDVTGALDGKDGDLFAQRSGKDGAFGSISANGEGGAFFQGGIASATFTSQPSGVFALELVPEAVQVWPPEAVPGPAEAAVIDELSGKLRIVGRLTGVCLVKLKNGAVGRLIDVGARPECDELIGHL